MPRTPAANQSQYKYNAKSIKRVPLDMQRDYFETVLKPAADLCGVGVNTYIKQAIAEKIERDQKTE